MLKITNIKASFKYHHTSSSLEEIRGLCSNQDRQVRHKSNFTVIKIRGYPSKLVFTIWWHANHANVTGVKSIASLEEAVDNFHRYTGVQLIRNSLKIDNICAVSKLSVQIPLQNLAAFIRENSIFKCRINRSFTPALLLYNNQKGVCLIFQSGNICFFGLKSEADLELFNTSICALMKRQ